MSSTERVFRARLHLLVAAFMMAVTYPKTEAALQVIGVQYQPDRVFPEYECLWHDRQYPGPCTATVPGANVKVFFKNTGPGTEMTNDVTLAGYSLKTVIKRRATDESSSIFWYWGSPPQAILEAGEPVWFKVDPTSIPTGGVGQAVVRLRYVPTTPTVALGVVSASGTVTTNITVDATAPQLASVGFSEDRMKVYLHWRRTGGAAPASVWMDGVNVTTITTTVGDPAVNFAASVIQLASPLPAMSYHVYQGIYADGKTATAGLRTWVNPFLYGTWGSKPIPAEAAAGKDWIDEATAHGVNCLVMNIAGGLETLLATSAGRAYAESKGYGFVIHGSGQFSCTTPRMWFIYDEPDYTDWTISGLPAGDTHKPGITAMKFLQDGEALRADYNLAPTTVNVDGNLKPYNYWNWGQVPDVFMNDAYYQSLLAVAYWRDLYKIPLYQKATYIYASAKVASLACEPNPMHMILYSCSLQDGPDHAWPFAPPATKRIEAYYALAGGAKGMAYWWYLLDPVFRGLADGGPAALALWKEIGFLGNEIKMAQPLLVTSHPVDLPLTSSSNVWSRALAVGTDAMLLLAVNDNYTNDEAGCHYTPVSNATVTATLPSWMQYPTAFEISANGITNVSTATNGNQLLVNLGTLNVTKMVVLTKDAQLQPAMQQRYSAEIRSNVCLMAPELCVSDPATITQQPVNQVTVVGGTVGFSVAARGAGALGYRWQKNTVNLSEGGHFVGSATPVLTIANCDTNDAASYRCVVTNRFGTNISHPVTLTVTNGPPRIVQQPSSQSVNPGGTANFFVIVTGGDPLSYRWQKNNTNLNNGGHYSGVSNPTLTISTADTNDVASYRCVVTNALGNTNSTAASLSLVVTSGCLVVSNADFESGFGLAGGGYIGNNWTEWETEAAGVVGYDETIITHGGGHSQRLRVSGGAYGTSGGAYQRIPVTAGKSYTVGVWIYAGDALTSCSLGLDPAGGTNAASGVTWSTATTNVSWVQKQLTVTATSSFLTVFFKVASSDNIKRNGYFDDATPTRKRPQLFVQGNGNALTFHWPECPAAHLEQAASLSAPTIWATVTNQTSVIGGQKSVTLSPPGSVGYFRLVLE